MKALLAKEGLFLLISLKNVTEAHFLLLDSVP
jgi:hypothetical protein